MFEIRPNRLYTTESLNRILHGFVKIESLRKFGLKSLPGKGYWGQAVIDALNRMSRISASETGVDADPREASHVSIFEKRSDNQCRKIPGNQEGQSVYNHWQHTSDEGKTIHTGSDQVRNVSSQREELFRLTTEELDQGRQHRRSHRRGRKGPLRL